MPKPLALTLACLIGALALAGFMVWARATQPQSRATPVSMGRGTGTAYTTSVTLPTYPYSDCLSPPETGAAGVPYRALDWECLSDAGPPRPQTYTLLVLGNDYLTVTLLPELGGRIYELIFKPTGHDELYRNPVLKPAPFGPPEQGWWLGVGGIEWGFPTDEHGYEWGIPWHYRLITGTAGVTVTLRDSDATTRPTVAVAVHLPPDRAALVIRPQIANPTARDVAVKYWTNALLAPGGHNAPSAELHFLFPGPQVTVHSTGDSDLPPPGEQMDWPVHDGQDYGRLGNWNSWLGFFEAPQAHGPFVGVYDRAADEGLLRVYPAEVARGSKGFAFGWHDPLPSSLWTDDDSAYVEIHGGLAPTFWDTTTLSAGQVVSWREVWYPVAGIGSVSAATAQAALRLEEMEGRLVVGLYTPAAHQDVTLYLWDQDCRTMGRWHRPRVDPAHPVAFALPNADRLSTELSLVALAADGQWLGDVNGQDCLPPRASVASLPWHVDSTTFRVTWSGTDEGSGIATYDVQSRQGYEGVWSDWLTHTTEISHTFDGEQGQTYFFRARARDEAGNVSPYSDETWGQAFTSVLPDPAPVLISSRKLANPVFPAPGQAIRYTVRLSNTGNLTASRLLLTDHLPSTLQLISGTLKATVGDPPILASGTLRWQGQLSPGREIRLHYSLTATAATTAGVPLTNTLHLAAAGLPRLTRRSASTFRHPLYLPLIVHNPVIPLDRRD